MKHRVAVLSIAVSVFWLINCGGTIAEETTIRAAAQTSIEAARSQTVSALTCQTDLAPTGPGRQHLALIIGVGDYAAGHISDLNGTVHDATNFRELLINPDGPYRLDPANTCLLTDEQATLSGVLGAANDFLLNRIDNEDHVTIFYAGHGGQVPDRSSGGTESDRRDETLVLHDSETPIGETAPNSDVPHLTDDVFGALLDALNAKLTEGRPGAHALTVILDSCNSLSATRGGEFTARFHDSTARYSSAGGRRMAPSRAWLTRAGLETISASLKQGSGVESITNTSPPGAVILSAAGDGRFALEVGGQGVFTSALVQEIALATTPLTYSQLEWRVRSAMKDDYQVPGFHGETDALLFDTEIRGSGIAHKVASVSGDRISLIGTPLFGIGPGAEFRIYDGALAGDVSDPSLGKAIVSLTGGSAVNPEGQIIGRAEDTEIEIGDLAVMITPSPETQKLQVALGDSLDAEFSQALQSAIANKEAYARSISLVTPADRYEFIVDTASDTIGIKDVEGKARNSVKQNQFAPGGVAKILGGFARQKSLRSLRGEGGGALEDNATLNVWLQSYREPGKPTRCDPAYPVTASPKSNQTNLFEVPVCSQYQFVIEASEETLTREIQVGVLYLSSDGNIYSIPNGRAAASNAQGLRLSPPNRETGEPGNLRIVLDDVYQALPPPEAEDEILVFGVTAKTPVPWWSLATNLRSGTRSALGVKSRLHREINAFIDTGTRNATPIGSDEPLSAWTVTRAGVRVVADEAALDGFASARGLTEADAEWDAVLCQQDRCETDGG